MSTPNDAAQSAESFRLHLGQLFPALTPAALDQLTTFRNELVKATGPIETTDFADCIKAGEIIFTQSLLDGPIYDFGSGAGFPGVIFGILQPERAIILVEKDSRRSDFLKQLVFSLKLTNLSLTAAAIEDLPERTIKTAVCRDFAPLSKAMIATRKITELGGTIFYLKGRNWSQELAAVPSQLFTYWDAALVGSYRIPDTEKDMSVISTKKTAN